MIWDWSLVREALPPMLRGFGMTILATILATVVALILGLLIAIVRRSAPKVISVPIGAVVEFIRSTPLLVQLFAVFVIFNQLTAFQVGITVLGIHYATYMSEVYRAGIDGVPKGQWEAATALSMSPSRTWTAVVMPQAVRAILPAMTNYAISMFKETPFLAVIGVAEMVFEAGEVGSFHFRFLEVYTIAGLLFLLASYPTSLLARRLEKRLAN
ncbi:ectoine/hydroxyectoine ABC transporter permease subunit EhuD [Microlunatus sp. Y2014]|uniref:ectoine/hydroxyectoine ABC transporter permease subunit EhuD n=1 Tax=Microlunatus sp. Y2014 TaxID=3418488 RepID=UPI003DA794D3